MDSWPGINEWNNPMNDNLISKIVSSARRQPSGTKNQKKPISSDMIQKIISCSDLDCLEDLRNCLIVSMAFCLLLRHNELSHLTLDHFEQTVEGYKITIPKSKTDKYRNGSNVFLKFCSDSGSVSSLLSKYLFMTKLKPGDNHYLFFPLKKQNHKFSTSNKILSYASYRDITKKFIQKIGLDPDSYGTHSMRSGGATLIASRVTEDKLLTTGRWSNSRSIRSYVEMSDTARYNISGILQNNILNNGKESSVQTNSRNVLSS